MTPEALAERIFLAAVGALRTIRDGWRRPARCCSSTNASPNRFTAPGDVVERMMYGWSVVHCLAVSRADTPSAALGTALHADSVRRLAADAGYTACDVLPIVDDFFRFYLLTS